MKVFYNELDDFACGWLSNLMDAGMIRPGVICDKSIVDLDAEDVKGYDLVHYFAGIGGWDHALTLAGWRFDGRTVWTGSPPCQPFSVAGKREGKDDERHLAPTWLRLIRECRPARIFGEQVGAAISHGWLDDLFLSLEQSDYACGAAVFPAASVGAFHIRERLYFVAHRNEAGRGLERCERLSGNGLAPQRNDIDGRSATGELADATDSGHGQERDGAGGQGESERAGDLGDTSGRGFGVERDAPQPGRSGHADGTEQLDLVGDAEQSGLEGHAGHGDDRDQPGRQRAHAARPVAETGCDLSFQKKNQFRACFWSDAIFIPCSDGKARPGQRPTQSVLQSFLDGIPAILGAAWDDYLSATKEEVKRYAEKTGISPDQALLALWSAVAEETIRWRATRGFDAVQGPQVLLAALCELARHMGSIVNGAASNLRAVQEGAVRALWGETSLEAVACPPSQRGLEGPQARELGNAVRRLSSWRPQSAAEVAEFEVAKVLIAAIGAFPLASGVPGRVGLLRGAGNAIVPQQAKAFLMAVMEATCQS